MPFSLTPCYATASLFHKPKHIERGNKLEITHEVNQKAVIVMREKQVAGHTTRPQSYIDTVYHKLQDLALHLLTPDNWTGQEREGKFTERTHEFPPADPRQADTTMISSKSQLVFIFMYLFFLATRYKLVCLVRKTCLIALCINSHLKRKCFSNKVLQMFCATSGLLFYRDLKGI